MFVAPLTEVANSMEVSPKEAITKVANSTEVRTNHAF